MRISKTWERAGDMGSSTLGAARTASDRARSTAAGSLVRAGKAVEPTRGRGSWSRGLLVVPALVAVALAAAAMRRLFARSGATDEEMAGQAGETAARPMSGPAMDSNGVAQPGDDRTAASR